jgi:dolichyl-phosphate-mannose--protein O-mannosyl transferase
MESTNNGTVRAYIIVTGVVFGLLALAHVWRVVEEGPQLMTNVPWVLITVASAALCIWAFRLFFRSPRS